ncbi:MAG TPA: hypothetical protein VMV47_02245 [Bacteroidales bacterium]|nr:hypothetical protein [Bacteroidales bacterium]
MIRKALSIIFLTPLPLFGFCQEARLSESIISIAEELASDDSDPEAIGMYIENLYELTENPVNINSADENEISRLFFLSDFQVKVLADYIRSTGKLVSLYELPNLPGYDRETAMMVSLFVTLDDKQKNESLHPRWRNNFLTNLTWKTSDHDSAWLGSPLRILTKYRFTAGEFSGGLVAEKDPGEKFLNGNPPLPDMISGHFAYNGKGLIKRIIIGDYSARFGQGSNINTNLRNGLSLLSPGFMSARSEIRPYTSTDENRYFRGAGAELSFKNLEVALFYSKNAVDASLEPSSDKIESVRAFYTSGLHNTTSTLKKKDSLTDMVYGINISYNRSNFRAGTTWSQEWLSLPFPVIKDDPATLFSFSGKSNSVYSFYYNTLISRMLLYGEMSVNEYFRYSIIQGFTLRPSNRLSINLLYRCYENGFISLHGKGPGSSSSSGSENSVTGNFIFEAAKYIFISGGCQIREYPWLRYRNSSPSYYVRKEIRGRYVPTDKFLAEAAYNYTLTTTDDNRLNSIPGLEELTTRSFSSIFRYSLTKMTLGTRFYYKRAEESGAKGVVMLQDINYRFGNIPLTLWVRFCLFNTNNWDTRIYIYENDLLYGFSIPPLYGNGSRNYLMVSWKIKDKAELRFKYGILSKEEASLLYQNIEEFKLQVRINI